MVDDQKTPVARRSGEAPPSTSGYSGRLRTRFPRMAQRADRMRDRLEPRKAVFMVLGMVLVLAVPILATLATVNTPLSLHHLANSANLLGAAEGKDLGVCMLDPIPLTRGNPTPYGYSVSLLIFLVPFLAVLFWQMMHRNPKHRKAMIVSSLVIASIGVLLDLFFSRAFFCFPNQDATLKLRVPAWNFGSMGWDPSYIPVEEFGFYVLGALFVIAVYIWADNNWLNAYSKYHDPGQGSDEDTSDPAPGDTGRSGHDHPKLFNPNWWVLLLWVLLMVGGYLFKRYGDHPCYLPDGTNPCNAGIPGYFFFIMILGFLPGFLFLNGLRRFVNWRSFWFAYSILLLVSIIWEATLGVPYDWWNYRYDQMLGHHVTAWANLPIEAVLLWLAVAWNCVIAYEICRVYLHMDAGETAVKRVRQVFLGPRATPSGPAPPSTTGSPGAPGSPG